MARHDHLRLVRLPERMERRKRPGFGQVPSREPSGHAAVLRSQLDSAIDAQRRRRRPDFVNPSLILRVRMSGTLLEEEWERLGLTVLSSDADRSLVLFSSSDEMLAFRQRLTAYGGPVPDGQAGPRYASFVANIESIGSVEPRDRIGLRFRGEGFVEPDDFVGTDPHLVDLELWEIGGQELRRRKLDEIARHLEAIGGECLDEYVGPAITMLRARIPGFAMRGLLEVEEIACIDRPPSPDLDSEAALGIDLQQAPPVESVDGDAPVIGIIDSGINDHPFLAELMVGSIAVPEALGTADDRGHGTAVAGIAVFGDLRAQLRSGALVPLARLCAAKVVNDAGGFDDTRLVPRQMREAITALRERHGCRIFVIALADRTQVYAGGKLGPWSATLDELARELDVLIIVASGNRAPRSGDRLEQSVTEYPDYLFEDDNRLLEPGGAANVLTVGSISHGEGIDGELGAYPHVRAITHAGEPSPFSRTGPGVEGAIKPDLIDFGGTVLFDGAVRRLRGGESVPSAGMLSLHHKSRDRLLTSASGTSYAAPAVANKAAQLLARIPSASANLLRALLVGSASTPSESTVRLEHVDHDRRRTVFGHGLADLERAVQSDDARVVLYADDELEVDHFAIYEMPIPEVFQSGGSRSIKITLAFDPPVRHTRNDYAGIGMSFRLLRGCEPELIFDHYRRRTVEEGDFPEIADRFQCDLEPGPQRRERGTVQSASVSFARSTAQYGDRYYLVVRCEGGWAAESAPRQRYAVVVELRHQGEVRLYEQLRQRVQLRV